MAVRIYGENSESSPKYLRASPPPLAFRKIAKRRASLSDELYWSAGDFASAMPLERENGFKRNGDGLSLFLSLCLPFLSLAST
jgi:hypothetical protein